MIKINFKKPTPKKKKSNHKFGYVYTKNYECFFLFAWLIPIVFIYDKLDNKYYETLKWDEKIADKILAYRLPKVVCYNEAKDYFWLELKWYDSNKIPLGYHHYYRKFYWEIKDHLLNDYCPDGYTKEVNKDDYDGTTTIYFKKKT